MLFYEPLFLFLFLPIVYGLVLLTAEHKSVRLQLLLGASVLFYLWSEPLFVPVVLLSAALDYIIAQSMVTSARLARPLLTLGIAANLAILVIYKYTDFIISTANTLIASADLAPIPYAHIALPIGVSFIVFEKITYLVDIYRGQSHVAPNFRMYLLYVFFFPKLLAGPIIKFHEMDSQLLAMPPVHSNDFTQGFLRFMLGVVKKTLLADTLAAGADMTFSAPSSSIGFADAWWGVIFFTFQIYFDFSAYSDMAIGLGRMLGFRLRENFDMPYISCSVTEFWRRWHMSLTSWIREYLYIPLGGNRVSTTRQYANLWLCFLASGLWHGAAWTYVFWGIYNGFFLVLDRICFLRLLVRMPPLLANAITLCIIMFGWVIFRATSIDQAMKFYFAMFRPHLEGTSPLIHRTNDMITAAIVCALICAAQRSTRMRLMYEKICAFSAIRFAMQMVLLVLFVCAVIKAVADPFKPFLYFRF